MKVTVLVENSKGSGDLKAAHGLAFLIEVDQYKLLFDTGPSALIVKNAIKLGINLSDIDSVVLSHGHKDHTGGVIPFRKINDRAVVYMHEDTRGKFRYKLNPLISFPVFNRKLLKEPLRIEPILEIHETTSINPFCTLFCDFMKNGLLPPSNQGLEKKNEAWVVDDFVHEIALLVQYENQNILFTGCSHNGLINIMESVKDQSGVSSIDYVFGGFHLYDPIKRIIKIDGYFRELQKYIHDERITEFYTGHCTGKEATSFLSKLNGRKVQALHTGKIIEINT